MRTVLFFVMGATIFILFGCSENKDAKDPISPPAAPNNAIESGGSLPPSDSILSDGLQATLKLAAERAVEELSKPGGFADSPALRIPLPNSFAPVESTLEKIGQEKLLDSFKDSLNEAARKSVAASPSILSNAIRNMKIEDALSLWQGSEDAATRYLEAQTRSQIQKEMLPIISEQTSSSGATRYLEQIAGLVQKKSGGLLGNLASIAGVEIPSDFDLDQYVSEKALDGLYATLAEEESKIRANPAARSTELVKSAFDYFTKK